MFDFARDSASRFVSRVIVSSHTDNWPQKKAIDEWTPYGFVRQRAGSPVDMHSSIVILRKDGCNTEHAGLSGLIIHI